MLFSYIDEWIGVSRKAFASLTLGRHQPLTEHYAVESERLDMINQVPLWQKREGSYSRNDVSFSYEC